MQKIDLAAIDKIIRETAATEIMPRFRKLAAQDIEKKRDDSSVTIADREAERVLSARLTGTLPGSVVVGEEGFETDPAILSYFGGKDFVWIIDPVDGTRNFIEGKPEFASMIALVRNRQTIAAWIHDPNSGDTLMAEQGSGVWMRGHKMLLAAQGAGTSPAVLIGSRLKKLLSHADVAPLLKNMPLFETGSAAAFDYGRLFTGDAVFADSRQSRAGFLLYRQSKPWDHVPGLFMHGEAGGYAADLLNSPYDMQSGNAGLLVAPDRAGWKRLHHSLKPAIGVLLTPPHMKAANQA